jgi:hypothetical protein
MEKAMELLKPVVAVKASYGRGCLASKGKFPPKTAGPTSRFGREFHVTLG